MATTDHVIKVEGAEKDTPWTVPSPEISTKAAPTNVTVGNLKFTFTKKDDKIKVSIGSTDGADVPAGDYKIRIEEKDAGSKPSTYIMSVPGNASAPTKTAVDASVVAAPETSAPAQASKKVKSSKRSSAADVGPASESGPEEDLQQFLAQKIDKYFDKIPTALLQKAKNPSLSSISPRITKGGWGPASSAALSGFSAYIQDRAENAAAKDFNAEDFDKINNIAFRLSDGDHTAWQRESVTISGFSFPQDDSGLLSFLKFAYVATRPSNQSGYEAAKEIGIETGYSNKFFPSSPDWMALCKLGAISPFFYVTLYPPADIQIAPESKITIAGQDVKHAGSDKPGNGIIIALGLKEDDKFPAGVPGAGGQPNVWGDAAVEVLKPGSKAVTLQVGDKVWQKDLPLDFGIEIRMTGASSPAVATQAAAASRGSFALRTQNATRTGRTVPLPPKPFTLQNIYVDNSGGKQERQISATVEKSPRPRGDLFNITAQNNYILVPAILRSPLREARHWVETLLSAPETSSRIPGLVYFPVSSFSVLNDANNINYGPQGAGQPLRVVYEPVDPDALFPEPPSGITVVSADAVDARGAGAGDLTPAQTAIARYFMTPDNPTGAPLYLTQNLNFEINSYPTPERSRVG